MDYRSHPGSPHSHITSYRTPAGTVQNSQNTCRQEWKLPWLWSCKSKYCVALSAPSGQSPSHTWISPAILSKGIILVRLCHKANRSSWGCIRVDKWNRLVETEDTFTLLSRTKIRDIQLVNRQWPIRRQYISHISYMDVVLNAVAFGYVQYTPVMIWVLWLADFLFHVDVYPHVSCVTCLSLSVSSTCSPALFCFPPGFLCSCSPPQSDFPTIPIF